MSAKPPLMDPSPINLEAQQPGEITATCQALSIGCGPSPRRHPRGHRYRRYRLSGEADGGVRGRLNAFLLSIAEPPGRPTRTQPRNHYQFPSVHGLVWTSNRCDPEAAFQFFGDRVASTGFPDHARSRRTGGFNILVRRAPSRTEKRNQHHGISENHCCFKAFFRSGFQVAEDGVLPLRGVQNGLRRADAILFHGSPPTNRAARPRRRRSTDPSHRPRPNSSQAKVHRASTPSSGGAASPKPKRRSCSTCLSLTCRGGCEATFTSTPWNASSASSQPSATILTSSSGHCIRPTAGNCVSPEAMPAEDAILTSIAEPRCSAAAASSSRTSPT